MLPHYLKKIESHYFSAQVLFNIVHIHIEKNNLTFNILNFFSVLKLKYFQYKNYFWLAALQDAD